MCSSSYYSATSIRFEFLSFQKELLQSELNIVMRTGEKEKKTLENLKSSYASSEKSAKEEGM